MQPSELREKEILYLAPPECCECQEAVLGESGCNWMVFEAGDSRLQVTCTWSVPIPAVVSAELVSVKAQADHKEPASKKSPSEGRDNSSHSLLSDLSSFSDITSLSFKPMVFWSSPSARTWDLYE